MATTWTNISKAAVTAWTDVAKSTTPREGTVNIVAGNPIGLLLSLTYAAASSFNFTGWSNISKSVTPNSWTDVPKAT